MANLTYWSMTIAILWSTTALSQSWENRGQPATIVELYTSEGCSSCPPAEAALNELANSPDLWTAVIPMAFHVDYWNYIGWKDRFAKPEFSQRQRQKVRQSSASGVYTPGWFVNDQEWRGFFARQPIPFAKGPAAPLLSATLDGQQLTVTMDSEQTLRAHYALLAMNQHTQVKRGENRGRMLEHHFVVIGFGTQVGKSQWTFTTDTLSLPNADAIAVWLTLPQGGDPVQTVAGWVENE